MRHRMVSGTGLGNPDPVLLDNKGTINSEFAEDAIVAYFSDEEGFDFQIHPNQISIGIEPTYQGDNLKIITIHRDKLLSSIETGRAWGPYGSGIAKTKRSYDEYKTKSKFIKFVDKWHPILFGSEK